MFYFKNREVVEFGALKEGEAFTCGMEAGKLTNVNFKIKEIQTPDKIINVIGFDVKNNISFMTFKDDTFVWPADVVLTIKQ
jgi:hypothetical protein